MEQTSATIKSHTEPPNHPLMHICNTLGAYSSTTLCNPHHRYLFEDLPYGCFPLQVLSRLAGVETALLDSCITIGSKFLNIPLQWTAEFLKLDRCQISKEFEVNSDTSNFG